MNIIKRLFGQRRWLAWLPVPAAALLSGGSLGGFFAMLLGGCILWVPYWLAYWLSDGFTTFGEFPAHLDSSSRPALTRFPVAHALW